MVGRNVRVTVKVGLSEVETFTYTTETTKNQLTTLSINHIAAPVFKTWWIVAEKVNGEGGRDAKLYVDAYIIRSRF